MVIDYRNWQMPLGRRFRSLKLYFVLRSFGVTGIQKYLRGTSACGDHFERLVRAEPDRFEMVAPRRAGLVVFRLIDGEMDAKETNALNDVFFEKLHERKDLHLTPGVVDGKACTRVAVGSPATTTEHMDKAWAVIWEVEEWARKEVGK